MPRRKWQKWAAEHPDSAVERWTSPFRPPANHEEIPEGGLSQLSSQSKTGLSPFCLIMKNLLHNRYHDTVGVLAIDGEGRTVLRVLDERVAVQLAWPVWVIRLFIGHWALRRSRARRTPW